MTAVVEMDETYLGTVRFVLGGIPREDAAKKEKDIVIALREHGGNVRLMRVDGVRTSTLKVIAEELISD